MITSGSIFSRGVRLRGCLDKSFLTVFKILPWGLFGNLIFSIIAWMFRGNHLKFLFECCNIFYEWAKRREISYLRAAMLPSCSYHINNKARNAKPFFSGCKRRDLFCNHGNSNVIFHVWKWHVISTSKYMLSRESISLVFI